MFQDANIPVWGSKKTVVTDQFTAERLSGCLFFWAEGHIHVVHDGRIRKLWDVLCPGCDPGDGDEFNAMRSNWKTREVPQSGVPGVSWNTAKEKWQIRHKGKTLGYANSVGEGAAMKQAAVQNDTKM